MTPAEAAEKRAMDMLDRMAARDRSKQEAAKEAKTADAHIGVKREGGGDGPGTVGAGVVPAGEVAGAAAVAGAAVVAFAAPPAPPMKRLRGKFRLG